jgi:hypothetical protein
MKMINTQQGKVSLLSPSVELLGIIRSFLPFGAIRYETTHNGAEYGIVMQCGDQEVYGIKQQPVPSDEEQGYDLYQAHSILIAQSIAEYLRNGFSGLLMPCAYIRKKEAGLVESGIAYFGAPSPQGRESQEFSRETEYDRSFGHGFTTMMVSFIRTLEQSSRETGIPLFQTIGLDIRPRSHFGSLGFGFMVVGSNVVCLKTRVLEQDPIWTILRSTGISEVFHIPSVPASINEADFRTAKPDS